MNNIRISEVNRKLVHLASLIMPIAYYFSTKTFMLWFTAMLFILISLFDLTRIFTNFKSILYIEKVFLRDKEKNRMSGGFFFCLACLIAVIFFSKYLFIVSVAILVISDTVAALVGLNLGRYKILDKSVEGSAAFFVSGLIVIVIVNLFFTMSPLSFISVIALFIATLAELFASYLKIDDNLLIVLSFGITYTLLNTILGQAG